MESSATTILGTLVISVVGALIFVVKSQISFQRAESIANRNERTTNREERNQSLITVKEISDNSNKTNNILRKEVSATMKIGLEGLRQAQKEHGEIIKGQEKILNDVDQIKKKINIM